jgi:1,4-alpha-glucan branching enzyme
MFLFGEEVGVEKPFLYGRVLENRDELEALRNGTGRDLFTFYSQLIRLRREHPGFRSPDIDVLFVHDVDRLIVFRRWGAGEDFLVVASLNNHPFDRPNYTFHAERLPGGTWREIFNSDAANFGGNNAGNSGGTLVSSSGSLTCIVPANSFIVLQKL